MYIFVRILYLYVIEDHKEELLLKLIVYPL